MVARKREDTAKGCRELAQDDQARATAANGDHMRHILERSADAWTARAKLLTRLEREFDARAGSFVAKRAHRERGEASNG